MNSKLLEAVEQEIISSPHESQELELLVQKIQKLKDQQLNILLVGPTGVGKSSTINALFNAEIAKVGHNADPETKMIQKFELDNIILWDSPGLGDNPEKDGMYAAQIASALQARDSNGTFLIDEAIVLIDGSNRDMKTAYEIIEKVVAPYIGESQRILIAINQCDIAIKASQGVHWSPDTGPDSQLQAFLEQKAISVQTRILSSTGIHTQPIYYSALYHYNISKLLVAILQRLPETKRFLLADTLNKDPTVWQKNDEIENYNHVIETQIKGSLAKALTGAKDGAMAGAAVGTLIPVVGPAIGAAVGATLGFLGGLLGL